MHAGRQSATGGRCIALCAVRALALLAAIMLLSPVAVRAQLVGEPLTVPTGVPPAPAAPAIAPPTMEELQALLEGTASGTPGGAPQAVPPRANPFATAQTPPAGQNVLVPLDGAQPVENAQVNDDHDGLISLMVRQGSLRQVVSMIAQTQQLNIVFAGGEDPLVTATFEKQPWDTVLDALLSASGCTWTTSGDVIYVSTLEVADFMPPDAGGQQVMVFELDFATATDVDQTIKGLLSQAGDSWITVGDGENNRRTREIVTVRDFPAYLARITQYVEQADQPPRQVFIEAHILQIELADDCRSGINFKNIISLSGADVTMQSIGFANTAATSGFLIGADGVGLDGLIELLQRTTDAKTLASPELHVVSGQSSKLQIGDQLPYPTTVTTQTATVGGAAFLDVGVMLEVTPRVTRDGRVLMNIKPQVSSGQYLPGFDIPSKKTTELETDILMCSGEGMVLGGLIQEEDSNVQSKVPWLGDIPYLGILFQKRTVVKTRKEIIVTLRPYVMPYTPIVQEAQDFKVFRADTPLTQGAICRFPRPFEPRMPDTFDHRGKHASHVMFGLPTIDPSPEVLMDLPPTEYQPMGETIVEELPMGPDIAEPALR